MVRLRRTAVERHSQHAGAHDQRPLTIEWWRMVDTGRFGGVVVNVGHCGGALEGAPPAYLKASAIALGHASVAGTHRWEVVKEGLKGPCLNGMHECKNIRSYGQQTVGHEIHQGGVL